MDRYYFLNGQFYKNNLNIVSIHDRGFRFGDGIFDTIRAHNGEIYQWRFHFARINQGLEYLNLPVLDSSFLKKSIKKILELNKEISCLVKVIITAGEKSIGYSRGSDIKLNIFIETLASPIAIGAPIHTCISAIKKPPANSFPSHIKTLANLNSSIAKNQALKAGFSDSIQLDQKDNICEFSSGNIFWIKDKKIFTPKYNETFLAGIIRDRIIQIFGKNVFQENYNLQDLANADEIFLTNTNHITLPVQKIESLWKNTSGYNKTNEIFESLSKEVMTI